MGTFVVTGAASGMGAASAARLREAGHHVLTVDQRDADVVVDLAAPSGRARAAAEVLDRAAGRLDGAVLAAGVGPTGGKARVRTILEVNYFGAVDLLTAWRPALAAGGHARCVVFGSNSTTTIPAVPTAIVDALLRGRAERAVAITTCFGNLAAPPFAYGASKIALTRWVRRHAVLPRWAGAGIRLNVIAPGAVLTPLLEGQLATPAERAQIEAFPIPVGHYGDPDEISRWVAFLCTDAAESACGAVIVIDGGTDAYYRADDWPTTVPLTGVAAYVRRTRRWRDRHPGKQAARGAASQ